MAGLEVRMTKTDTMEALEVAANLVEEVVILEEVV